MKIRHTRNLPPRIFATQNSASPLFFSTMNAKQDANNKAKITFDDTKNMSKKCLKCHDATNKELKLYYI